MSYQGFDEKWLDERMRRLGRVDTLALPLPSPDEPARKVALVLPWPPSLNHNITHGRDFATGKPVFWLSPQHKAFRVAVKAMVRERRLAPLRGPLRLTLVVFPPDKRERDISNLIKPIEDALQAAGLFENDEQIDDLLVSRVRTVTPGGEVLATCEELR